jgi:hypothetical protein
VIIAESSGIERETFIYSHYNTKVQIREKIDGKPGGEDMEIRAKRLENIKPTANAGPIWKESKIYCM